MIALRDSFLNEDFEAITERADALEDTRVQVNEGMVELAVKVNGIQTLERINAGRFDQLENTISELVDVDLTETIVELNRMQTAYESDAQQWVENFESVDPRLFCVGAGSTSSVLSLAWTRKSAKRHSA